MSARPHILLLEPYHGGSHRAFLNGLQELPGFRFTLVSLPARKWKMRMQLAAPWMAEQTLQLIACGETFDALLCSTFVDAATLRALLARRGVSIPIGIYFHENQFAYPNRVDDSSGYQFAALNFTSALAGDALAFNSDYNRETFLEGVAWYLRKAADMDLNHIIAQLREKSRTIYPGIDFSAFDGQGERTGDETPVIAWNHRWEHDKDPETFFNAMAELSGRGIDFKLIILGQSFSHCPEIFARSRETLRKHIIHFGYAPDRKEYSRLLCRADIVVSTAIHEFFGMAVLEAVRCGCLPLVPDRLSYRELFPARYRYPEGGFMEAMASLLKDHQSGSRKGRPEIAERFSWSNMAPQYEQWLASLTQKHP